jgi:hypothetical protein
MNARASHVVEWSESFNCFRIRSISDFVASNVRQFFQEVGREYAPIGFFDSNEDAVRFVESRNGAAQE